jgi:hypothetical protein
MNPPIVYELTKPRSQRTTNTTAMVRSIFRNLLPRIATFFHRMQPMMILPDGLEYRYLSETRIAVCLIPGPVFVLWFTASSAEGTVSRDSSADHS